MINENISASKISLIVCVVNDITHIIFEHTFFPRVSMVSSNLLYLFLTTHPELITLPFLFLWEIQTKSLIQSLVPLICKCWQVYYTVKYSIPNQHIVWNYGSSLPWTVCFLFTNHTVMSGNHMSNLNRHWKLFEVNPK